MFDHAQPSIAVANVVDSQGRLLLTWNEKVGSFYIADDQASIRAASRNSRTSWIKSRYRTLGCSNTSRTRQSSQVRARPTKVTTRCDIKDYQYNVVPVEAHPDFASQVSSQPLVWAAIGQLQTVSINHVSKSVEAILRECVEWGWIR